MSYKWIGAILIVLSCGGFGFSLAAAQIREEHLLRDLARVLDFMECELQYRLTPLPTLCQEASQDTKGEIGKLFSDLSDCLKAQVSPNAEICMRTVLEKMPDIPVPVQDLLLHLGSSLGRFDLVGQLKGIDSVRAQCRSEIASLLENKGVRLRSYETLGLCAGAALAILFI